MSTRPMKKKKECIGVSRGAAWLCKKVPGRSSVDRPGSVRSSLILSRAREPKPFAEIFEFSRVFPV